MQMLYGRTAELTRKLPTVASGSCGKGHSLAGVNQQAPQDSFKQCLMRAWETMEGTGLFTGHWDAWQHQYMAEQFCSKWLDSYL